MKILKRLALLLIIFIPGYGIYYGWRALPIISGYGAKNLCSCVMLGHREPDDVIRNELGSFPLSLGSYSINHADSSASASVFGLARRKAIYRKGLGCTLVVEVSEAALRGQQARTAERPVLNTDTIPWPAGDRIDEPPGFDLDYNRLNAIVEDAFTEPGPEPLRRTRAILIVYKDSILAEKYADGFDYRSPQIGWSMTKSVTNALVGILVRDGKLVTDAPAPVDSWQADARKEITLNDLMHQSSGLEWEENYFGPSYATNMLFKKSDMGGYSAQSPPAYPPGEVFYYSSGTTNIISKIIRQTVGDEYYYRFPYEELFHRLGMYSMTLEPDASGTFVGSSYSFATARDWARFGLLYLHDGLWEGKRILPERWVTYSTAPAKGARRGQYGAQFWLNAGAPGNPADRVYPDVPTDLYWADGFEGQNVFILPSKQLVVVKLSESQGHALDDNAFLKGIIALLP